MAEQRRRIGFVSTRFSGTDGVSLESAKWSGVLTEEGHECFYFAGESDRPAERSRVVAEAHFEHPVVRRITVDLFDDRRRLPQTSEQVRDLWRLLKLALLEFIHDFQLDVMIVENALAIPMNIPLGPALTEVIAETNITTIAHHHDFAWERSRYSVGAADDYLQAAFPPAMACIHHVVINSFAAKQLALRTGMRSTLIPNVMDFDNPPDPPDGYADDLREALGLACKEIFHTDIQPKGFQVIRFDEFLSQKAVDHARAVVQDRSRAERMVEHNYELGRKHYSYGVLRGCLGHLIERSCGYTF